MADFAQNDAAGELNGMSSVAVRRPSLAELEAEAPAPGRGRNLDLVLDISVPVTVELGHTRMKIADLLSLHSGAVIELEPLRLARATPAIVTRTAVVARDLLD